MKTKGALVWELNPPRQIDEIEIGDPRRGEVTVQLETAGLCHSDHHLMTGDFPIPSYPVRGDHEGAGIITEIGEGVENLAVGDHVIMSFIPSCGKCTPCQTGLRNVCDSAWGLLSGESVSDGSFRVTAQGRNVIPMSLLGTFAPYVVVHHTSVVKIDPTIPFNVACLVGCGVTTGYGPAVRSAAVPPGDDVAVIGIGGVGVAAPREPASPGPDACCRRPLRRETRASGQVRRDGGVRRRRHCRGDARPDVPEGDRHRLSCRGQGRQVVDGLTAKGGTCVLTGMDSVMANGCTLNLAGLSLLRKSLQGSIFGGGNPQHDTPAILELYKRARSTSMTW